MRSRLAICIFLLVSLCAGALAQSDRAASDFATKTIRPEQIRAHMRFLSDTFLQGRAPGTPGYDIAARYVATELEGMGLHPGVSGGWYQPVKFEKAVNDSSAGSLSLTIKGQEQVMVESKDYVLSSWFASPVPKDTGKAESDVSAPVVFVGFGVTAPDQKYDDYSGIDVRGKILAVLDGAPSTFPSTERAYYSDGFIKAENAVARGAVGVLAISLVEDWKRYPWDWIVPQIKSGGLRWVDKNGAPFNVFPQIRGRAFLSQQGAETLFKGAPKSLDEVFATARAGKPQAFALPVTARIHTAATHSVIESSNIVAELKGSDPALRDQYVVYTAHVDHLGICPVVEGDNVCHGAMDNASGTASLLEIARAYANLPKPPRRSILFVFVTGEEKGLLGSDYFAHFPTVPRKSIVANVNIDGAPGLYYSMKDIVPLGSEHSSLGNEVASAAKELGYKVSPDPLPEEVDFIRSDQYSFVLQGVPAVDITDGVEALDPKVNGLEVLKKWLVTRYHTPLDNMDQPMDLDSAAKGSVLNFLVGYQVAQHEAAPTWNKGDFFGTTFGPRHNTASNGE